MPGYENMNELLKGLEREQPKVEYYEREGLGKFRRRLEATLNKGADVNLLNQSLPEKLKRYLTTPQEQAERRQRSRRMVTKKVGAHTAQVGLRYRAMPFDMNQADSAIRYYLSVSGQSKLLADYENVMALSTETLEESERKFRVQEGESRETAAQKALEKQEARRRARGTLLTSLLEPLRRTSPQRIADLTDEEAEKQYAMYHAMLELVRVLEEPLKADEADSVILFTPEEREICKRALDFLHPLERIECQTNLICNPYYQYLNTKAITKDPDVKAGYGTIGLAFKNDVDEYLQMFGRDLDMAVTETKREAVDLLEEELRNHGFNPDEATYTHMVEPAPEEGETGMDGMEKPEAREEDIEPDSEAGINYIYGGGRILVTQGTRQVEVRVRLDRSANGIDRDNSVDCEYTNMNAVLEIRSTIRNLRLRGIRCTRPDGTKMNLQDPENMEYLNNGGEVVVTADNGQVILSVDRENNYRVSCKYTPEHALIKMRERLNYQEMKPDEEDYVRENAVISEAAEVNETKWEAQALYQQLKKTYEVNLKAVSDLVKDADPALLKSSEQYKRMRSSLKELRELLKENEIQEPGSEHAADSMRRLKLLTTNIYNAANDYLIYKGTGTTNHARRRVEAAKAVKKFASQQLQDLNKLAVMNTIIQNAKGKDSLEKLLNKKITRDRLYRMVTEPNHGTIRELSEEVRGEVTQAEADKVVKDAQKKDEEIKKAGVKPKATVVRK